jgi:hypothetical protein
MAVRLGNHQYLLHRHRIVSGEMIVIDEICRVEGWLYQGHEW